MIVIEKEYGKISYNDNEIIIFIEEQLKMVPGVLRLGKNNVMSLFREHLSLKSNAVSIYQVNKNEIFIDLNLTISSQTSYLEVETEIKKLLKYTLYKKYGLEITSLDIYIQNLI